MVAMWLWLLGVPVIEAGVSEAESLFLMSVYVEIFVKGKTRLR